MILGLCGRKFHGKDTFASILTKADTDFKSYSFARRLKDICKTVYGLNEAQVSDHAGKEMLLPQPIELDSKLDLLGREVGFSMSPHGLVANTPRQVLQFVGTDYIRSQDPGYWVRSVLNQLTNAGLRDDAKIKAVITDVRFPNECDAIRSWGGKVLKIMRLSEELKGPSTPEHASEQLDFKPDYTLAVCENDMALPELICALSRIGDLDWALRAFDWEKATFAAPIFVAYYSRYWGQICGQMSDALKAKK